jgi:tetratricopeptide (TPR) repeat protein
MKRQEFKPAFDSFRQAASLEPANTNYWIAAGSAALRAGLTKDAHGCLRQAWARGCRTREVFHTLLTTATADDNTHELDSALALLQHVPPGAEHCLLHGEILWHFQRPAEAIGTWQRGLQATPSPALVSRTAQAFLARQQPDLARRLLQDHEPRGLLDEAAYGLLVGLLASEETQPEPALAALASARRRGLDTPALQLERAMVLLLHLRSAEAAALLEPLHLAASGGLTNRAGHTARLFLSYLYLTRRDRAGVERLQAEVARAPRSPQSESEGLFHQAVLNQLSGQPGALELLQKAQKVFRSHPSVEVLLADELTRAGLPEQALEGLRAIAGPLRLWPPALLAEARALARAGRDLEAARVVDRLHRRHVTTKDSLELFRDLAFKLNHPSAGAAAQRVLEQKYPDDAEVLAFRGFVALGGGAADQAAKIFADLSARYPEQLKFKLAAVQVLLAEGKFEQVLQASQGVPGAPQAVAPLAALAHAGLRQWPKAAQLFAQACQEPQPATVHLEYGKVLGQLGRIDEAMHQFEKAAAQDRALLDARLGLALAWYQKGNLPAARDHARALLTAAEAQSERNLLLLASAEARAGQFTNALDYCDRALARTPASLDARALRGSLYRLMGRRAEASADLTAVLAKQPERHAARYELARVRIESGQLPAALDLVLPLAQAQPTNLTWQLLRLDLHARLGQADQAAALLEQLRASLPPVRYALVSASLAEARGETNQALVLLEPHVSEPPAAVAWARLLFLQRAPERALPRLRQVELRLPQWLELAEAAERARLSGTAAACYDEALKLDPANPTLLNNWAWNVLQQPACDLDRVLRAAGTAYELTPRDPHVLDTYAEALLRGNRALECISVLERNLPLLGHSPQLLHSLARAYQQRGEVGPALTHFRRTLELAGRAKDWPLRASRSELAEQIAHLECKRGAPEAPARPRTQSALLQGEP